MTKRDRIYIIGGGTVFHVRPHLALSAPAYGGTARELIHGLDQSTFQGAVHALFTKMAGGTHDIYTRNSPNGFLKQIRSDEISLETNDDVAREVDKVIDDPRAKILFLPAALCDFVGTVMEDQNWQDVPTPSGKDQPRLKSRDEHFLKLTQAEKIISRIRKQRKDLFLVGFKSGTWNNPRQQFEDGLKLLKTASCNLVVANDLHTKQSMIVTPEQSAYGFDRPRVQFLTVLVNMALSRSNGTFTRSTVVDGPTVPWSSDAILPNLRMVVDHCVARGAYKPFLGATVGHFAARFDESNDMFITSKRKTDFNDLANVGMVLVESKNDDQVIAHGARPSVGGQSQRIIFRSHSDVDAIFHAHIPLRESSRQIIPIQPQWQNECGSHQCGKSTSDGLKEFGGGIKAVYLDKHGPNVCFSKHADPTTVINFIETHFDLAADTSGV